MREGQMDELGQDSAVLPIMPTLNPDLCDLWRVTGPLWLSGYSPGRRNNNSPDARGCEVGYCMFSAQDSVCEQPHPLALNLRKCHNGINV